MTRQRMVKPEFFDSYSLAECSYAARLLFIGLWVVGDDNGNSKMAARKLKLQVFPYDDMTDDEFADCMIQLESTGCIKGYEIDGDRYINVPNFNVYQKINRPSRTTIPKPPKSVEEQKRTTLIKQWMGTHGALTEHSLSTHSKERNKEGENVVVLRQQQHSLDDDNIASGGAAVAGATPPSAPTAPICPLCSSPVRFDAHDGVWRCDLCGDVKEPAYREVEKR